MPEYVPAIEQRPEQLRYRAAVAAGQTPAQARVYAHPDFGLTQLTALGQRFGLKIKLTPKRTATPADVPAPEAKAPARGGGLAGWLANPLVWGAGVVVLVFLFLRRR